MSTASLATLVVGIGLLLGVVIAFGVWRLGIAGKSPNKWIYGLRFTLWSVVLVAFMKAGMAISRMLFGVPGEGLTEILPVALGVWLLGSLVLFPIGVLLGSRKGRGAYKNVGGLDGP